jgi:ceramide glucosyltransferase
VCYGAEVLLSVAARWHVSMLYPVQAIIRDLMLPILWIYGWCRRGFVWRGTTMSVDEAKPAA